MCSVLFIFGVLDMSPEAKSYRARKAQENRTPEKKSEIGRKSWITRRLNEQRS